MAKVGKKQKGPRREEPAALTPVEIAAVAVCARHGNKPDELLEIFHELQHELGYVPDAALPPIAQALNRSRAEIYGVLTFYHEFHRHPVGRNVVKICRAEACQAMGTDELCRHAEHSLNVPLGGTTADGSVTIEQVFCLGNCALSPAVMVGEKLYGKVDSQRFDEIIAGLEKEAAE
ncbi:NADH-quinone oxidoreductase subunit E [Hyphomicrobium methylovorum]|uniref:NAD(P)H-dependent oxidoreductase subunit E n=1 Tax=Hyphomicrobium methylovorum TaxID=84 RepID=UPI0015E6FE61|nr:NAD(P)H-dependent oxidoreductase subunit E [Hyphomicrobium methylovorum]MBA2127034.1 NADH-quinone oxidoreductase subunit E [Hyphomicrobium methylovorum]